MSRIVMAPPEGGLLADGAKLGGWWHESENGKLVCDLCPRECVLKPGDRGFCFVRENRDGQMALTTYGRSTGFCIDPIEKKPLNHFLPGTSVLSFGTAGCNLGCKFCQNHDISKARKIERLSERATPEQIARAAGELGCRSVAYTYNDPVIWAEYAIDTARACREMGLKSVAVTAGYITPQARAPFFEFFDAANVDLKAFTEEFYYKLTLSHLKPVLETLQWLKRETDVWFEITNLMIPGANDTPAEVGQMCDWILSHVGDDTPVHFTAFHPDFRMLDTPATPPETLVMAQEEARRRGLKFAYVGNVHDHRRQSTYCPDCGGLLIERDWYDLGAYHMSGDRCGHCGSKIPGHFEASPGDWGRKRQPVRISQFAEPVQIRLPESKTAKRVEERERSVVNQETKQAPRTQTSVAGETIAVFTEAQRATIHRAASQMVAACVLRRESVWEDAMLDGVAHTPLLGAYVSLKRRGRLRACCGFMSPSVPLGQALLQAARRTASEDPRLPPISASELEFLDLEVWLLSDLAPVTGQGEGRKSAVEIGRHGLQIVRGPSRGLLLPGVATDHGLDAEGFLEHVSIKANLPPTAWKEDDVQLFTFEGVSVAAPFVFQEAGDRSQGAGVRDQGSGDRSQGTGVRSQGIGRC